MPTRLLALVLAGAAAALTLAAPAAADELYATIERTAAPGERALVHVRADAAGPVTIEAYRVEGVGVLLGVVDLRDGVATYAATRPALEAARAQAGRAAPAGGVPRDGTAVAPRGLELTFVAQAQGVLAAPGPAREDREALPSATIEVPLPAAGLYVLEVRHRTSVTGVVALVSRLALVTKRDPNGLLAFCVDRTTGRAVEGAKVEVRRGATVLAAGTTDAEGLLRIDAALPATADVTASSADHLALGTDTYYPADVADRRVHVATSQPAYRPGERVEVKGIVRAWRDGAYALDAEVDEVLVRFLAADGLEVGAAKATVSRDLGTFAAGLDLPATVPTGDAKVVVDVGRKAYEAPFRVEAYRKPTFELAATPTPARVLPGGELAFDVVGTFFEGGPLAAAPFTWTLTYHRVTRDLFPTDELARLFFASEREAFAPETVAQGAGTLDATGRATVRAKAPARDQDGFLTLRVVATGPDRTTAAGSGTAGFAASPLAVGLKTDKHLYGAEATARVTVYAVRADGRPAADRAAVVSTSLVRDGDGPAGGREEAMVGTFPVTTGPDGRVTLDVPLVEDGRYAVSVAVPRLAAEPAGPPAHAVVHVWVVGDRADVGFSGDHLEVVADRDAYAVGDVARLLVLSPVGARPFLSTVEGARLLAYDTVALGGTDERGATTVVEVEITPAHVPNAYVGIALVNHGHLLSVEKLLRVPPVDRLLVPTVTAAKTVLEPGESVAMAATVTDASGAPVANAEIAVAIVDDALYALYADPFAPLAPFFHPVRRNDVRTGGALDVASVGWSVRVRAEGKRAELGDREGADGSAAPPAAAPAESPRTGAMPTAPPGSPPARDPASGEGTTGGLDTGGELYGSGGGAPSKKDAQADGAEGPLEARADFRTAVFWSPTLRTGPDGKADLGAVTLGASLTRWRVTVHAVDAATRVGSSTTTLRTAKQVLTRVTLPRFLRRTDTVRAPWVLHSLLATDADADYVASTRGLELTGPRAGREVLRAGALVTHDLTLTAPRLGEGTVRAELRTKAGGDAMVVTLPVLPQGVPSVRVAGARTERGRVELPPLTLPPSAEPGTARLVVSVVPSVAQAVGAALPYLADYPYGCTEQTMSRLVPVVVAKVARDTFGAPPTGRLAELSKMLDAGLARLRALQHEDGGFGWWEPDASDAYMTAYVVHGLTRAVAVMDDPAPAQAVLAKATPWLVVRLRGRHDRLDPAEQFVRMALADAKALPEGTLTDAPPDRIVGAVAPMTAAFAIRAAVAAGARPRAASWLAVLEENVTRDAAGVRWAGRGGPGRWSSDAVESTAWVAGALLALDAKHPDLPGAVRWLLDARAGGDHWQSTRDTAACVAFLTRYAAATDDLGIDRRVDLELNGLRLKAVLVTPENAFAGAGTIVLEADDLPQGPIRLTATSEGPVTVTAALRFTDTGPAIAAADAGFAVRRTWWALEATEAGGKPVVARRPVTETVPSGTLLDVDVTVTTTTARDLVMVTSPYVAGFEPERDVGTAYATPPVPAIVATHTETRDDRTVFFVTRLEAGTHVFRHRVRAVHAGAFTALPASAELLYFPTVTGHGAGEAFEIRRAGAAGVATEGR